MVKIIRICGDSMLPQYGHNDYVLVCKSLFSSLSVGDVIVVRHKYYGLLIKRICCLSDDCIWFEGTNVNSMSSGVLGKAHRSSVIGRVVYHWKSKN